MERLAGSLGAGPSNGARLIKNHMFKKLPTAPHQVLVVAAILFISLVAFLFEEKLITALVFERNGIAQGELWRLVTGHFFHTNVNHLLLNLGGLVLLWALHGQHYQIQEYTVFFVFSLLFISLSMYFFSPDIGSYVGLSGVLHGVFVWGAIYDVRNKIPGGYLLLTGVIGKLIYEQVYGPDQSIETLVSAKVAVDAHLWGAISGLLFALFIWQKQIMKVKKAIN